jgi:hypothetical protein
VTFECEPGTLQKHKLETLRKQGVTRLSLGVENFKAEILQYNGRAHLEEEIYRAFGWARDLGFPQINLDLIAGMVGEDWDNWKRCIAKTIELSPDCVTIYQMELPYNTVFSKELKVSARTSRGSSWPTGRPSGPGFGTPSTNWRRPGTRYRAPRPWSKTRRRRGSCTARPSGMGPTCSGPGWRPSGM